MKIISLNVENVKRLSAVHVAPKDKGLVIVAGKNGAGKSSVLDSIEMALGGGELPKRPVRRGEDKATVEVDLGELIVRRTITAEGGGTLIVRNKDNVKQPSPQKILDSLYGTLSFDPLEFFSMKPDEQRDALSKLLGLDFTAEDKSIGEIFEERTGVNRDMKSLEAQATGITEYKDVPAEELVMEELLAKQQEAVEKNAARDRLKHGVETANGLVYQKKHYIEGLAKRIDELTLEKERIEKQIRVTEIERSEGIAALEVLTKDAAEKHSAWDSAPTVDMGPFVQSISTAQEVNRKVRSNKSKKALREQWREKEKKSTELTEAIGKIEKAKRDKILAAKFPVEGLLINDVTKLVEYNGIPLEQASTAERLRVSVAMGIAMNPKLRVLLVRQGNDLDDDNIKLLAKLAEEYDCQVWLERVSKGDASVVIEDGHVAVEAAEPVEAK